MLLTFCITCLFRSSVCAPCIFFSFLFSLVFFPSVYLFVSFIIRLFFSRFSLSIILLLLSFFFSFLSFASCHRTHFFCSIHLQSNGIHFMRFSKAKLFVSYNYIYVLKWQHSECNKYTCVIWCSEYARIFFFSAVSVVVVRFFFVIVNGLTSICALLIVENDAYKYTLRSNGIWKEIHKYLYKLR